MNKKQIDNLEKLLKQCQNSIPDYPVEQKAQPEWYRDVDKTLTVIMCFLCFVALILIVLLIYTMESGVAS